MRSCTPVAPLTAQAGAPPALYEGAPQAFKAVDVVLIWDAEAECYALHPLASVTRLKSIKGKLPPMTLSDPLVVPVKRPTPPPASSSPPVSAKRLRGANGAARGSSVDSRGRASTPLAEAEETDDFDFAGAPTPQPPKSARMGTTSTFVPTPNMTPRSPAMSDGGLPARSTSGGKGLALVNMVRQASPPRPLSDEDDGDDDRDDDYEEIVLDRRLDPAQLTALAFAPAPAPIARPGPFAPQAHPPVSMGASATRQRSPGMHSDEETEDSESDEE